VRSLAYDVRLFERTDFIEDRVDVVLGDTVLFERFGEVCRNATEGFPVIPIPREQPAYRPRRMIPGRPLPHL